MAEAGSADGISQLRAAIDEASSAGVIEKVTKLAEDVWHQRSSDLEKEEAKQEASRVLEDARTSASTCRELTDAIEHAHEAGLDADFLEPVRKQEAAWQRLDTALAAAGSADDLEQLRLAIDAASSAGVVARCIKEAEDNFQRKHELDVQKRQAEEKVKLSITNEKVIEIPESPLKLQGEPKETLRSEVGLENGGATASTQDSDTLPDIVKDFRHNLLRKQFAVPQTIRVCPVCDFDILEGELRCSVCNEDDED